MGMAFVDTLEASVRSKVELALVGVALGKDSDDVDDVVWESAATNAEGCWDVLTLDVAMEVANGLPWPTETVDEVGVFSVSAPRWTVPD